MHSISRAESNVVHPNDTLDATTRTHLDQVSACACASPESPVTCVSFSKSSVEVTSNIFIIDQNDLLTWTNFQYNFSTCIRSHFFDIPSPRLVPDLIYLTWPLPDIWLFFTRSWSHDTSRDCNCCRCSCCRDCYCDNRYRIPSSSCPSLSSVLWPLVDLTIWYRFRARVCRITLACENVYLQTSNSDSTLQQEYVPCEDDSDVLYVHVCVSHSVLLPSCRCRYWPEHLSINLENGTVFPSLYLLVESKRSAPLLRVTTEQVFANPTCISSNICLVWSVVLLKSFIRGDLWSNQNRHALVRKRQLAVTGTSLHIICSWRDTDLIS